MAAPKGNTYAAGLENSGRPLKFESVDELDSAIDEYFDREGGGAWVDNGDGVKSYMPTMSGLALSLGIDRKTLLNYSRKEEYFLSIKKAKTKVEAALEQRLYAGQPAGVIFNLKNNFGWNDKVEVDNTSSDGSMSPDGLTPEQRMNRIQELMNKNST